MICYLIIMGDWNSRVGRDKDKDVGSIEVEEANTMNIMEKKMIEIRMLNDINIGNISWKQLKEDNYKYVVEGRDAKSITDQGSEKHWNLASRWSEFKRIETGKEAWGRTTTRRRTNETRT